jgi:peptidyl-prolyl cis-trans isomerase SurA
MISRAGDEAVIRHILRIPPVNDDEISIGKHKLDSVRSLIIAGKMNFNQAVGKYTEDEAAKFSNGEITARDGSSYITIDVLDKDVVLAIKELRPGDISQPIAFTDERGKKAVRLVYYKSRTEPHRENLKDDYNRIAQRALEEKKVNALQKWFKDRIPTYYITIDKEFADCINIAEWQKVAAKQ